MARWLIVWSALSAALAVGLGAFGAHALREKLPQIHPVDQVARMEANWETASRYHLIHAVGALVATLVLQQSLGMGSRKSSEGPTCAAVESNQALGEPSFRFWVPVYCLLLGPVVFSGCLYAMVLGAPKILGAIVPVGGALMILGWVGLAVVSFVTSRRWPSS
ncbi:MAG: DUF423 domain-containing protein [Pirellulaceae bacterium]|nr:DUF423 domain-containing protein [Pirellulaceae bacterium]